jgi:hypothetical protein
MQDNFEQIRNLLEFETEQDFYFIQVLQRRKENPDMRTGVRVINNYYLYNSQDLDRIKERVIEDCKKYNARAYINLNRLNTEKVALYTIKMATEYVIAGDYKSVKNAYSTACGNHHSEKDKKWVIDIDERSMHLRYEILEIVTRLHTEITKSKYKILAMIPTRTGLHIITNPFNMLLFRKEIEERAKHDPEYRDIDIHKNSPTILYIN